MIDTLATVMQIVLWTLALKGIIWGVGGPTLRGWYDVVPRDKSSSEGEHDSP